MIDLNRRQQQLARVIYDQLPEGLTKRFDHLIVHCSATPPSMTEVDAAWIDRAHRRRGWMGNGYNAVIPRVDVAIQHDPTGHRCRPYAEQSAHVGGCGRGWNERSVGVTYAGGVGEDGRTPEANATEEQLDYLAAYIVAATSAFDIPRENVMGHRDLIKLTDAAPKACPSFSLRSWLGTYATDSDRADMPPHPKGKPREKTTAIPKVYEIRKDDTLWSISNSFGVPMWRICELNKMDVQDTLYPGDQLRLMN